MCCVLIQVNTNCTKLTASLVAGLTLSFINFNAVAVSPIDLKDDRKVKSSGYDLIYEARDIDLPQNVRDGLTQARSSLEDTKKRVAESRKRFTQDLPPFIKNAYWTEAKEALRLQIGTLRFDLNTLIETRPKTDKKAALAAKRQFFDDVEKIDFAIREKKMESAERGYNT